MLNVLTFSTLFPNEAQPNLGIFVERQTQYLAASEKARVIVVNPIGMPPWPLNLLPAYRRLAGLPLMEERNGLTVYRPRFLLVPRFGWRSNARAIEHACGPLLDTIRQSFPFDVVDAQFFYPCGVAAVRLARRLGVPVSVKARGADIHYWGTPARARDAVVAAGKNATGCLAVSRSLKADMASIGIPAEKIRVHYTGVDLARFSPADPAPFRGKWKLRGTTLLSIGLLIPRKGHDLAIRAVASLPDVSLVIAGDGPERGRLRALIGELGLGDRVRLVGPVPHQDVPGLMRAVDGLLLCSASEGLANVWVEALACGRPIVISDVDGAREVHDGSTAVTLFQERTPEAIARAVGLMLADPPAPDDCRAIAERFSWSANTRTLVEHLTEMVSRGGSQPPSR